MSQIFFQFFDIGITCFEIGGYYYLIKTEKRKKTIQGTLLYFVLLLAVTVIMSAINMSFLQKYGIIIVFMTIGGSVVFECSIFKNFLYSMLCIFSIQCSESLAIQVWRVAHSFQMLEYNPEMDLHMVAMVIGSHGIYFMLMAVFRKIMQRNVDSKTKLNEIIPIIISGVPFIIVLECLIVNLPYLSDKRIMLFSLGSSGLILFVFIFNMIFTQYYNMARKKALLEEHAINELQLKYEYYKNKKENEELIKEIYHDLKNYFLIYKDDLINKELRRKLSTYESYYMTGNEFLDVIISDKLRRAASNNIQAECKIDFKDGQFMEALDLSTVFGNLLDNAIEACMKMPESERLIWINVGRKRQFMFIQVKNTAIHDSQKEIGKMTDKPNKSLHGFGIANIKKTVRKYDGECGIAFHDGIFEVNIVIPIPAERNR